jgi:hypothetical protein
MSMQKIISQNVYRNGGGVILVASVGEKVKVITPPIMPEPRLPRVNADLPLP